MEITVYRCRDGNIYRQVISDCHLEKQDKWQMDNNFFLVVPGDRQRVFVGDRIFPGVGPWVTDWDRFIPSQVPQLLIVTQAVAYYVDGEHHHTEAAGGETL